ncbi:glycosyltransferase, partial [Candidatus Bathyarchaeota archaeon]
SSLEKKHDDVFLLIVGSGEFEAYCRRLAKELNIKNIMFKGYVPESDIELYHNVCDVLVLPSIFLNDYPEPNGYVLYESMSVGKPLIVTDAVGAVPELVKNEINGFVVKNKDVAELEVALSKIIASKKLREKMSKNSRELFKEKISLEGQFDAFRAAIEYATQSAGSIERNT